MSLCLCGCGLETPLAQVTNQWGVKGQPRRYYPGHRDRKRDWHAEYRERNRASYLAVRTAWRARVKLEALTHYGGDPPRCRCCGERHVEFLNLDHTDGNGNAFRRSTRAGLTGVHLSSWLKRRGWPDGIRVLCYNCNLSRGAFGYCPHDPHEKVNRG